jgi:hypothetical protein
MLLPENKTMAAAVVIRFGAHATPGEQDDGGAEAPGVQLGGGYGGGGV